MFEAALLEGNQREATSIVRAALDAGSSLVAVELHIMRAALYHIGEEWQANRVTVAQEHMASAIVQSVMTTALLGITPPPMVGHRVLLACVEGNTHAIGLRMVADAFQLSGWEVQYLGANVPTAAIVQQVVEWTPTVLALSVSFAQQLPAAKAVMAELERRLGDARPSVILGGLAINRFRELASFAGADSYGEDADAAVVYGSQHVSV
jgi:methanogenic corrinoid protein MtbC1